MRVDFDSLLMGFLLVPILATGSGCASLRGDPIEYSLNYQSLWDEAFEETVTIVGAQVFWFQHRDPPGRLDLSRNQILILRETITELCYWAGTVEGDPVESRESITVNCGSAGGKRVSLIRASAEQWGALGRIDLVVLPRAPDYVPIVENAKRNLGY